MTDFKIIFVDPNQGFCDAIKESFDGLPEIEVVNGYFQDVKNYDCMVSPANSFGIMDGGVDLAIIGFFGIELMERVQQRIVDEYLGEQPVGTSMIVETGHPDHPFLAHTPTMRVPMTIAHTDHVYLAMWALLRAVYHHNQTADRKINAIACPGLGTGYGHVPYRQAARQMALAYKHFLSRPTSINELSARTAWQKQSEIRYGGDDGFDIPPDVI